MKKLMTLAPLFLAACNGGSVQSLGPAPVGYRAEIAKYVREHYLDPYSVRDAQISKPFPVNNTWYVCTRSNAKNKLGGYMGLEADCYGFLGNSIRGVCDIVSTNLCNDREFTPFTEIEMKGS